METGIKNEIIVGRPYGGTIIFFRLNIFCYVSTYKMDS